MTAPRASFCGACGEVVSGENEFCGACGARVSSSSSAATGHKRRLVSGLAIPLGIAWVVLLVVVIVAASSGFTGGSSGPAEEFISLTPRVASAVSYVDLQELSGTPLYRAVVDDDDLHLDGLSEIGIHPDMVRRISVVELRGEDHVIVEVNLSDDRFVEQIQNAGFQAERNSVWVSSYFDFDFEAVVALGDGRFAFVDQVGDVSMFLSAADEPRGLDGDSPWGRAFAAVGGPNSMAAGISDECNQSDRCTVNAWSFEGVSGDELSGRLVWVFLSADAAAEAISEIREDWILDEDLLEADVSRNGSIVTLEYRGRIADLFD